MRDQERLRVLLELDRGAGDVLSGRIGTDAQHLEEFSGWLSLIAVIEAAREASEGDARSPPEMDEKHSWWPQVNGGAATDSREGSAYRSGGSPSPVGGASRSQHQLDI